MRGGNDAAWNWRQNPVVKMFTLIKWSLLKDGHFILLTLGSSYTFNAIVTVTLTIIALFKSKSSYVFVHIVHHVPFEHAHEIAD